MTVWHHGKPPSRGWAPYGLMSLVPQKTAKLHLQAPVSWVSLLVQSVCWWTLTWLWMTNQITIETRGSGSSWNLGISVTSISSDFTSEPHLLSLSPRGIIFLWIFHGVSFLSSWFLGFLSLHTYFLFVISLSLPSASASSSTLLFLPPFPPPPSFLSVNILWHSSALYNTWRNPLKGQRQ